MTAMWRSCNLQTYTIWGPGLIFQALVQRFTDQISWASSISNIFWFCNKKYCYKNIYKDYANIKKKHLFKKINWNQLFETRF